MVVTLKTESNNEIQKFKKNNGVDYDDYDDYDDDDDDVNCASRSQ